MAKIIYNEGEISGKLGGKVYSRNRWGTYVRDLAIPVQPRTSFQLNARARLASIAGIWPTLSASQRLGWQTFAGLVSRLDRLGQPLQYNGFTAFMLLNSERAYVGLTPLSAAPTLWTGHQPQSVTFSAAVGVLSLSLVVVGGIAWTAVPAATELLVESCRPQSPGAEFAKTWRTFASYGPATPMPIDLTSVWTTRFGTFPGAGARMFLRAYTLGHVDSPPPTSGFVSTHVGGSVLVT